MINEDAYFNDEEFREILNEYEQAAESGQTAFMDADDLAEIADYYRLNDRMDEAAQAIGRAMEVNPDALPVLNYKIHEALSNNDPASARLYLDRIIERDSPDYIYNLAEILITEDQVEEADAYLREMLKDVSPDEYQDFVLDVANIYIDYGVNEKAMQWMLRARQEDNADFKELMARTLFGVGNYQDSEKLFNELLDANPFQKRYWNALASAQYMNDDYNASITSSEYAIAIDPNDSEAIMAKANGLYRLENFEEALKYYERYTQLEPDDELGFLYRGTCLINLGQHEEAAKLLHQALEVAQDDSQYLVEIYQELAFAYSEMQLPETAIHYIDKTEELDCDHVDMQIVRGHILLANNQLPEAEQRFKQALADSGNSPKTMMRIIISLYDNKYLEAAYQLFKILFQTVDNDWKDGYAYAALCCWDSKRYKEFMEYLKLACEKNPKEAKLVLGSLFPEDMAGTDYYTYMINKIKE